MRIIPWLPSWPSRNRIAFWRMPLWHDSQHIEWWPRMSKIANGTVNLTLFRRVMRDLGFCPYIRRLKSQSLCKLAPGTNIKRRCCYWRSTWDAFVTGRQMKKKFTFCLLGLFLRSTRSVWWCSCSTKPLPPNYNSRFCIEKLIKT